MDALKDSPKRASPVNSTPVAQNSSPSLRRVGAVAAVVVLIGAVAGLLPRWHQRTVLAKVTRELSTQTVTVVTPSPGEGSVGLTLPAEIKPFLEAPIYARASGYIKKWLVDIGALVKEGDVLAEIDTPELNQELAQARAQLFMAQAAVPLAKATAARWAELVKTTSVSEQEAAEKASELKLRLAAVDVAAANVSRLEELQRFQNVKAPFDGMIIARNIDLGQLVMAGSARELFRLTQTSRLRVFVRVPQSASHGMTAGHLAELTIPELPGRIFKAKVVRTSGSLNAESRTLMAELDVDNEKGEIFAGAYAQVRFSEVALMAALTLPSNTLLFRPEGPQVGLVSPEGKVELRTISIGRDFGPSVEVLSGVSTNDQVILNPPDSLASGTSVQITRGAR
jgi:membrane fusion protein, multidrug efflux system